MSILSYKVGNFPALSHVTFSRKLLLALFPMKQKRLPEKELLV